MSTSKHPTPDLTTEQQEALAASDGIVQGESWVLMRTDAVPGLFGYDSVEHLRKDLTPAFEQADRGELSEWNVDEFLRRMHDRSVCDEAENEG